MGIKENIKLLREYYKLSQKEFAQIAGVTDKAVSTWESGAKEPRMGAIQKIADHFGLKKSNIIEDGGLFGLLYPSGLIPIDPSAEHYDWVAHTGTKHYYVDPETAMLAQELKDNPQYRVLLDSTKKLKPEGVKEVMKFIDYQLAKEKGGFDE